MSQRLTFVGLAALLVGGGLLVAFSRLPDRVAQLPGQAAEAARHLTTEPESIPDNAVYQRYRRRREAVAAMRADLVRLVAAESAYIADSGRATAFLPPEYLFPAAQGNTYFIELLADGWSARIQHTHTAITCTVTVTLDTTWTRSIVNGPECSSWRGAQP